MWSRWVQLGVGPDTLASDVKRVLLVNGLTLVILLLGSMWIAVGATVGAPIIVATGAMQFVGFVPVLLLNRSRRHVLATVWALSAGMLILLSILRVFGPSTGAEFMFLSGIPFPFLAFAPRHRRLAWGFSLTCAAIFLSVNQLAAHVEPLYVMGDSALLAASSGVAVVAVFLAIGWWSQRATATAEDLLEKERQRSEGLLLNILPPPIAARLMNEEKVIADAHEHATVLFSDLVGFTPLSATVSPSELVAILDDIFRAFDVLCDKHGLEKIKTIGDAYMVAGGLPEPRADHAQAVARFGLDLCATLEALEARHQRGLALRVGVHTGPIVAGVIGHRKFAYDLWGDTVNTAARMESHGVQGRVQISAATREALGDAFEVEDRGEIEVKGKGKMRAYLLVGPDQPSARHLASR